MTYNAHLLILNSLTSSINLKILTVEENWIRIQDREKKIDLELPKSKTTQGLRLAKAFARLKTSHCLLKKNVPVETEDEAIAWLLLEDYYASLIGMCWQEGSNLIGLVNGNRIEVTPKKENSFETLYLSRLIREGYTLKENKGVNLSIISPTLVEQVCTPFECLCSIGVKNKKCKHIRLANCFIERRECFDPLLY